jgi:hypothetical protein
LVYPWIKRSWNTVILIQKGRYFTRYKIPGDHFYPSRRYITQHLTCRKSTVNRCF